MKKMKAPVHLVGKFAVLSGFLHGGGMSDQHEDSFYRQAEGALCD